MTGDTLDPEALAPGRVLINFRRYAACPVCNQHLAAFRVRGHELRRFGVRVLIVFHSPAERLEAYFDPAELPFSVITDPEFELYDAFGVERSALAMLRPRSMRAMMSGMAATSAKASPVDGTPFMVPANFMLEGGKIRAAHYGRDLGDAWSVDEALKVAAGLWPAAGERAAV